MNKDKNTLKLRTDERSYIEEVITNGDKVQALYQKIGSKWFTYYLVEDELFMSSVDEDMVKHGNS